LTINVTDSKNEDINGLLILTVLLDDKLLPVLIV